MLTRLVEVVRSCHYRRVQAMLPCIVSFVKYVKLGTAEAVLLCAPKMKRFDSQNLGPGDILACCVNLIRGNNSGALGDVQA
jgi:hypothetical protein